jgi:aromatic ring-opening dioxygenase catalytic subunit (LigB family)
MLDEACVFVVSLAAQFDEEVFAFGCPHRRNEKLLFRCNRRQLHPGAARHAPRSDHYTPLRMTFGTARDLSAQVVAIRMTSFGMLMNSPHSEFQRIYPLKTVGSSEGWHEQWVQVTPG